MVAAGLMLSSCASIFTSSDKKVTFKGVPGTTVIDVDKNTQVAEIGKNGFAEAKIRKGLKSKTLKAEKEGYEPRTASLDTKIQGWWWGNLVLGDVVGMSIDAATIRRRFCRAPARICTTVRRAESCWTNRHGESDRPLVLRFRTSWHTHFLPCDLQCPQ